jgi:Domain of unknown function (DUF4340)
MSASASRRRTVTWMAGAALVAVVLGAVALLPAAAPPVRKEVGSFVAPGFAAKAAAIAQIKVTTAEETYALVRQPQGWVEPERGSYKVASGRIDEFTRAVAAMKFAAPMTRDEKKFDRIGLGDPTHGGTGALVEAADAKGAALFRMIVGYRDGRSYVREPDDLQVWAVAGEAMPPLQRGARWLDLDIAPVSADAIREVDVQLIGQPIYRLVPKDAAGAQFALAPPYDQRKLAATFAPTLPGQALTHFSPTDVAPVAGLKGAKPVADHVTRTKAGLEVAVRAMKVGDRGWVTLSARALAGASPEAAAQAAAITARAAGWAFALGANDWSSYATPLDAIIDPK